MICFVKIKPSIDLSLLSLCPYNYTPLCKCVIYLIDYLGNSRIAVYIYNIIIW